MDPTDLESAWAEVTARWGEEAAHQALLARFGDLEGLAEVGRRYRAALDVRPDDAMARRWRDEVVKRATVIALAQLPRTKPPRRVSPGVRRATLVAVLAASVAAVAWALLRMTQVASTP